MQFNNNWSQPHKYDSKIDSIDLIENWGCKSKAGIYVIRDEFDERTLYVGKAEGTSRDIKSRLQAHLQDKGNTGIGDLVSHQQKFVIRWAESASPGLSESVAIVQLEPLFNKRPEWSSLDRASLDTCLSEAERLGLIESRERALDNLSRAIAEDIFNSKIRRSDRDLDRDTDFSLDRF